MTSLNQSEAVFRTADLILASFLWRRGFEITALNRQAGRTSFVFEDSTQLRAAVLEYANKGSVAVRTFCGTMRNLKAIAR